jgi:hypothetical protein
VTESIENRGKRTRGKLKRDQKLTWKKSWKGPKETEVRLRLRKDSKKTRERSGKDRGDPKKTERWIIDGFEKFSSFFNYDFLWYIVNYRMRLLL